MLTEEGGTELKELFFKGVFVNDMLVPVVQTFKALNGVP